MGSHEAFESSGARHVLVVDDQCSMRESLALVLEAAGFEVTQAAGGKEALKLLQGTPCDAILADLKMEDMDGLDLLRQVKRAGLAVPFIMITGYATIQSAVEAMKLGAADYVTKPYNQTHLISKLRQALEGESPRRRGEGLSISQKDIDWLAEPFVTASPQSRKLLRKAIQVANTNLSVLITGETGTGKTMLARIIHRRSARSEKPFTNIDCAALPAHLLESELFGHMRGSFTGAVKDRVGLFEVANGGTIFLDEIECLPESLQAKLLGVLQDSTVRRVGSNREHSVDVRVISATSSPTAAPAVPPGLREDLYYRINGIHLHIKPLRERVEDVRALANTFLKQFSRDYGRALESFEDQAIAILINYPFRGNVRQLRNIVEQIVAFAPQEACLVTVEDLPDEILEPQRQVHSRHAPTEDARSAATLAMSERVAIVKAIEENNHNLTLTAEKLGIGRTTLWRKMRRYGVS